jgi:hypothetical protein
MEKIEDSISIDAGKERQVHFSSIPLERWEDEVEASEKSKPRDP